MATVLRWREFAAGRPFHAALVPLSEAGSSTLAGRHSHADFHELICVAQGHGVQRLANGATQQLNPGDLALVRPRDTHDFVSVDSRPCEVINIAFASERWHAFLDYAEVSAGKAWDAAELPVLVTASDSGVESAVRQCLADFQSAPKSVDLIRMWTAVVPALEATQISLDERPEWLSAACSAMYSEANLVEGLSRLRSLAGVSDGHLARSMTAHYGCSPVEFVNRLRLDHAAKLLATTTNQVGTIASRCGFSSHAYFCGKFQARFGSSPGQYRNNARRAVLP
jgi:AraC family cel operon transcriptional repressor